MILTRKEFDELIKECQEQVLPSWNSTDQTKGFPVMPTRILGRCRYCGKRTSYMYMSVARNRGAILDTVSRLMRKSNGICNLDCLYNFIIDRTPEIIEEITR